MNFHILETSSNNLVLILLEGTVDVNKLVKTNGYVAHNIHS